MAQKRIYYAVQQVAISADGAPSWTEVHGLQSVGMTTTFNLDQVFELGQLAIYENIEGIPDCEVTLTKVLDGRPLVYHLATQDAGKSGTQDASPTLAGRSNAKCYVAVSIFDDTAESAAASAAKSQVQMSGMYVSSLAYNIPLEDSMTEDVTLVGNNRVWANIADITPSNGVVFKGDWPDSRTLTSVGGQFATNTDDAGLNGSGVQRRENLVFGVAPFDKTLAIAAGLTQADANGAVNDPDITVLPTDIPGITSSGTNELTAGEYGAHASSISVSCDLGREEIFELGRRGPYHRVVTFPIEVTCEIEVTATSGDMISATEQGILSSLDASDTCGNANNLSNRTIRLATCDGTIIYLGTKNKLASVNYGGGDAGGGNVAVTYTYTTFNDLTVLQRKDPADSGSAWFESRAQYVCA